MVNPQSTQPKFGPFAIPEPAIASHPGVILAPRELRSWTQSLPLGNPPRAAQLILQQLRLLVRDPEPGGKLAALLELYDESIERLLEIVTDRLSENEDQAVPLDQLEHALVELLTELAYGQLRIANELVFANKAPPAALLYRALDLLDTARNIERLRYCGQDGVRWRLMLDIYLRAEHRGIDTEAVTSPPRRADGPRDIRGLFFRALVIGLCDPNHHRPGDILAWHRWTGTQTDGMVLSLLPQGAFSIPIDISGQLSPLNGARRGKPGPDTRYLVAEDFLRRLNEDQDAPAGLYRALNSLIRGRKSSEQRNSPRQPRNHAFRLLYGLRQVHTRLGELTSGVPCDVSTSDATDCVQINQSKSGAAFRLQGPLQPPLGIGEIILAEADNPHPGGAPVGFIARIQRLHTDGTGGIEIGVEKLAGRLVTLNLSGGAAERTRGDNYAMLQQHPDGARHTLIAVRGVYREGDSVIGESANARYSLRMKALETATQRTAYIDAEPLG